MNLKLLFLVSSLSVSMRPCTAQVRPAASARATVSACDATKARFSIGLRYSKRLAERARQAAHARDVRKLEPGMAYTMEYASGRLNFELDRRGAVKDVRCG